MSGPISNSAGGRLLGISALAALGVVFGDLGTSPLYALHDTFAGSHAIAVNRDNVLGVLSLFVWSLVLVVCVKYLTVMMRADNHGEGGIFALLALTGVTRLASSGGAQERDGKPGARRARIALRVLLLGIAGAALLYGDGVITPAISVLSAVEGLTVATSVFEPYVVPITVVVLVALFAVQPLGSGRIGRLFGPVIVVWFLVIAALGLRGIVHAPGVLWALDPRRAVAFFSVHGWRGFPVLGGVVLCLTGVEALYADMGHFGRRPIRLAWFGLAFPSLLLSYLGQGGVLLADAAAAENPFFRSAPGWALYPLVALATLATVIASQALITAVFSLTSQAVQLGLSPRFEIRHTSSSEIGQIYLPALNWVLMLACLALVVGFRSSTRLAAAYGLAVSGTMAITTLLFVVVARDRWKWSIMRVTAIAGVFLLIDLAFLGANLLKVRDGGWIPLAIGVVVFTLLSTWRRGRALLRRAAESPPDAPASVDALIGSVAMGSAARVPGTAVYMHAVADGVPRAFLHNLTHNKVVHERVIFLTVLTEVVPFVGADERVRVTPLADAFWRVVATYGYMEQPAVPAVLTAAETQGVPFRPVETTYFLSRESIISSAKPGMARWRERLFGVMMRNARPATGHFGLPPNRVVELGVEVEI
ncbi:MAG TPA: potassium uptake protein [Gemmatimonadaceae bacterium]|nr:potassium uptake protein [Gemmatimonadaceae bacterium]